MRIKLPNFYVNYKLGNLCFQHEIKLPVCSESGQAEKLKLNMVTLQHLLIPLEEVDDLPRHKPST